MRLRKILTIAATATLTIGLCAPPASAEGKRRASKHEEFKPGRTAGPPVTAVVALGEQRVTIYDADGPIMRAPISSGQPGYETPAGIYSVIGKAAEHYSNLYDDASMPFMQRITWSGIALHAGALPGRPASHGCVRMPYPFAERLFGVTKLGMRVVIVPHDIAPVPVKHPAPLKAAPVAQADVSLVSLDTKKGPPRSNATLRAIAEAKSEAARAATRKAEQARREAVAKRVEVARDSKTLRMLEVAKTRAEERASAIERALQAPNLAAEPEQQFEQEQGIAAEAVRQAQDKLETASAEGQQKKDAAEAAREAASTAEAERAAAEAEAQEAQRKLRPITVFISRSTERLYARQGFEPVLESAVSISEPDQPLGTYVLTALRGSAEAGDLSWSAVAMYGDKGHGAGKHHHQNRRGETMALQTDAAAVERAVNRISIPPETLNRVVEVLGPGSSLIISDEPMSKETGKGTDFIVLMSGEPQGGIKIRRKDTFARYRMQRPGYRAPYRPFSWW